MTKSSSSSQPSAQPLQTLYPLQLVPQPKYKLWGGGRLVDMLSLSPMAAEKNSQPLGEVWQVCDTGVVARGALQGWTLAEVAAAYGTALVGTTSLARYGSPHHGPRVPLLSKWIDAREPLSVQVHPDDAYARVHEASSGHSGKNLGKAEAWYVVAAEKEARIVWDVAKGVSKAEIRAAAMRGALEPLLNTKSVQPGDVIYNPPGTVHAIGGGIVIFEIQQHSDLTYRLYDYDRTDAGGNKRPLHLESALAVLQPSPQVARALDDAVLDEVATRKLTTPYFVLEVWQLAADVPYFATTAAHSWSLLTVVAGHVALHWHHTSSQQDTGEQKKIPTAPIVLATGDHVILPATLGAYSVVSQTPMATLIHNAIPRATSEVDL